MKAEETKSIPSGYGKPPWVFKGSALYQLNLVKAEIARAFIPKEFRLVEAFGYTLGGFFLANYSDSPAGTFDELVVIGGIVWNPPTSCAWATRVLVSSDEACIHGRKDVGLPSYVAKFSKHFSATPKPKSKFNTFLNMIGVGGSTNCMEIQVSETKDTAAEDFCNINLTTGDAVSELNSGKWMGPTIKMSLPSYSGRTEHNPHLLKYSCQIECRVKPTSPAKVLRPSSEQSDRTQDPDCEHSDDKRNLSIDVMLSKPILALQFNCLKMDVESPLIVCHGLLNPTEK
ncbi:protein NEOXANTHIN-DEFICIENT 1 [Heracleum sosnowskyi]|uniref:Protein NEOXANTHIN-DEFICIENT 1 n=1 Tax=Heracleum sosnowskyi TaxID=360622 RepID=A0AAD8MAH1_9APIA|nr:protein NEOXANTHIN-DEFICIENT 1 [Heracleum sosnowskyi]